MTFAVVLVLVGLQAGFTFVLLNQVAQRSAEMISPALNRVDDLAQIEADVLRLRAIEYSLTTSNSQRFQEQLITQMGQLEGSIGQHLQSYASAKVDSNRSAAFSAIRDQYQQYAASLQATESAVRRSDSNEALWQYLRFEVGFGQLDAQIHDLRSQEYRVAKEVPEQMAALAAWSRLPVALMVLAVAGAELTLGWHLSRGISRSLDALEGGARRIGQQKFDEPVAAPPEPELAALAGTLNQVMEVLAEHGRQAVRLEHERAQAVRDRVSQVVRAQERERARISRELHDEAGQALTALNYGLSRVQRKLVGTAAAQDIDRLLALAADTGKQIAALARDLRPGILDDLGLIPALRSYTRDFSARIGIPVTLSVKGHIPRISQEAETAVFRVVQEALTNVAKHAEAASATVELRVGNGQIDVEVVDDGQGFNMESVQANSASENSSPTLGLAGIRERVRLLGGEFRLVSRPREGTHISVSIPLIPPVLSQTEVGVAIAEPVSEPVLT